MKNAIIYYSYSGNTKKVALEIAAFLKESSEVSAIELKCSDESKSFLMQCKRAFNHIRGKLEPVNFDLSSFDVIYLGTPVWAFAPVPAVNTFLDNCSGLTEKKVILFSTYGSGTGNKRCLDYMQKALEQKGAKEVKRFSVQQFKTGDKSLIISLLKEAIV